MSNTYAQWPVLRGRIRARQLFPRLEETPDINRGEQRLAAEVALAVMVGRGPSPAVVERGFCILETLAFR